MKRVHLEIVLGTIFVFLSALIVAKISFSEEDRLAQFEGQQVASRIEFGAAVYHTNCTACHGEFAQGVPGVAPCLRCEELLVTRLGEIGWQGSLEDYIVSVVTVGRQVSTRPALYPGGGSPAMPTWSEKFGGPLRGDQIKALAAFITNFQPWADNPDLVPTPVGGPGEDAPPDVLGRVAFATNGCTACHSVEGLSTASVGPSLNGIATRAATRVDGLSAEEYLVQSILEPGAYVVEGFADGIMPPNFGDLIAEEGVQNLLAFLLTLSE
ncbi:MAG: cytochrome c [Chloroflexota bacterium]